MVISRWCHVWDYTLSKLTLFSDCIWYHMVNINFE